VQLLSALPLQLFYGIGAERQLMEQLDYNVLYRWFAGFSGDLTSFTKKRTPTDCRTATCLRSS
jgi:transposase